MKKHSAELRANESISKHVGQAIVGKEDAGSQARGGRRRNARRADDRARQRSAEDRGRLRPGADRSPGRGGGLCHHGTLAQPVARRACGRRYGPRQCGGQVREEPSQDARPLARSQGGEIRRRHRRAQGKRHRRDRAPGRRGGGDHALDQSRRHTGEQDHQRAERAQRRDPGAFPEGLDDLRQACRIHPRRIRQARAPATSCSSSRRPSPNAPRWS